MTKEEQIYTDYLITKVRKDYTVEDVAKKYKCCRKYVYLVVARQEAPNEYKLEKSLRPQEWKFKYSHIQRKLRSKKNWTKEDVELQNALIRHLYRVCFFDDVEIARCTKVAVRDVRDVLGISGFTK